LYTEKIFRIISSYRFLSFPFGTIYYNSHFMCPRIPISGILFKDILEIIFISPGQVTCNLKFISKKNLIARLLLNGIDTIFRDVVNTLSDMI